MSEPYKKEIAIHLAPESCVGGGNIALGVAIAVWLLVETGVPVAPYCKQKDYVTE
jgi:hypothetical protein